MLSFPRRLTSRSDISDDQKNLIGAKVQEKVGVLFVSLGLGGSTVEVADPALLGAVVDLPKGRKLVSRVLGLLPQNGPAMLPVVLHSLFAKLPIQKEDLEKVTELTLH